MINYDGFYIDYLTLNSITLLIFTSLMFLYLLSIKEKTEPTKWFIGFFAVMTVYAVVQFFRVSSIWARFFYGTHILVVVLHIAAVLLIQFAYRFPYLRTDNPLKNKFLLERKVAFGISILFLGYAVWWGAYQISLLTPGFTARPTTNTSDSIGLLGVSFLWAIIVFLRKSIQLSKQASPNKRGWSLLFRPQGRLAKATYGFVIAFVFSVLIIGMETSDGIPQWIVDTIPATGVLINLFLLGIIYFNQAPEKTSFMAKLVGISLTTLFLIIGFIGSFVQPMIEESFVYEGLDIYPITIRFERLSDDTYSVSSLPVEPLNNDLGEQYFENYNEIIFPFSFPFFHQQFEKIEFKDYGIATFNGLISHTTRYNINPTIALFDDGSFDDNNLFIKTDSEKVTATWLPHEEMDETEAGTYQMILYKNGTIDMVIYDLADFGEPSNLGIESGNGGSRLNKFLLRTDYDNEQFTGDGVFVDYRDLERIHIHERILPLAYLVFGSTLLILIGFPIFFNSILVKPISQLVRGVQLVDAGDFETVIPVFYQDEIGVVTGSFNRMVNSLYKHERELESLVEERTEQLADRTKKLAISEERERIARELHDDLGQVLGYVSAQSQAALVRLRKGETGEVENSLAKLSDAAKEAHTDVRQYILDVRTEKETSAPEDLFVQLDILINRLRTRHGFNVRLRIPAEWEASPFEFELGQQVYRIIQEAINNARKYSDTIEATIEFIETESQFQIIIVDEGKGFDLGTVENKEGHFGLNIMRERIASIGGKLDIWSRPDQGTKISLYLVKKPIEERNDMSSKVFDGIRTLLVDDHNLFLDGLQSLLEAQDIQVVGTAKDGVDGVEKARELKPDLILMDLQMPNMDGIEATRKIKMELPETKIVMLTMAAEGELLFEALKSGASGYLLKSLEGDAFYAYLESVLRGEVVLSPSLALHTLSEFSKIFEDAAEELPTLTARQHEVLSEIAKGKTNKEIAAELHMTTHTVKYHLSQILERLQLRNRYEVAQYAWKHGFTDNE
jgi:DNA-binding NarL/FixJ family response regulator/signal transduction histidine kinase